MASTEQIEIPTVRTQLKGRMDDFGFTMWLFIHRAQLMVLRRFLTKLDRICAASAEDRPGLLAEVRQAHQLVWQTMITDHHSEEDDHFFPWLVAQIGEPATQALASLKEDHQQLAAAQERLEQLFKGRSPHAGESTADSLATEDDSQSACEELRATLKEFTEAYTRHFLSEEAQLVGLMKEKVPVEEQKRMAAHMRDRGKQSPHGTLAFALFRDAAMSNAEDQRVWEDMLPWFVRNVVLGGISLLSGEYADFVRLLPN